MLKSEKSILLRYIIFCLLFFSNITGVSAMGLFGFMKVCLSTDMTGRVAENGVAVSDVKVVRKVVFDFTGKEYVTETVTDKNGKFHFNALYTKSVNTFLPSAKMVTQTITFSSQGKEYLGWHFVKGNYDYNGELNDLDSSSELVPFELSCDFNNDENFVGITDSPSGSGYTGICRVNKK